MLAVVLKLLNYQLSQNRPSRKFALLLLFFLRVSLDSDTRSNKKSPLKTVVRFAFLVNERSFSVYRNAYEFDWKHSGRQEH